MRGDFRYKHINEDSKILGLSSLFRGANHKRWSMNLYLSRGDHNHISFCAAPILARYRTLNPSKNYGRSGKSVSFTIRDAQTWDHTKVEDYLALTNKKKTNDSHQNCFTVKAGGIQFFIPQFELARVLFYHDPYLARLSLQHNALNEDFYIDDSGRKTEIHVLSDAEYPLTYYHRDDNRRFLSWVLLDKYARESFESIGAGLLRDQYGSSDGGYQLWDYRFDPPPLTGVELKVSGWHDFETNSFFVWEIWAVKNIPSSVSGEVDFINPNYERSVGGGKPVSGGAAGGEAPDEYELDDDELSDIDKTTIHLKSENVTVSFANAFITNRISSKNRSVTRMTGDGEKEFCDKNLSANEKDVTGTLAGGSWNNLNDETDDAHLYLSKFKLFLDMVERLEESFSCTVVNKQMVKLLKVGKSKKHLLADSDNPRCLVIIELIYKSKLFTLLEIDTSDGVAKLSTMVIKANPNDWINSNLSQIKVGIIRGSLGWPSDIFKENLAEDDYMGIPHPKSKYAGKLESNEIGSWAQRFLNWMKREKK